MTRVQLFCLLFILYSCVPLEPSRDNSLNIEQAAQTKSPLCSSHCAQQGFHIFLVFVALSPGPVVVHAASNPVSVNQGAVFLLKLLVRFFRMAF